jgi:hypothetical protein
MTWSSKPTAAALRRRAWSSPSLMTIIFFTTAKKSWTSERSRLGMRVRKKGLRSALKQSDRSTSAASSRRVTTWNFPAGHQ